jgi:hypothetical protein
MTKRDKDHRRIAQTVSATTRLRRRNQSADFFRCQVPAGTAICIQWLTSRYCPQNDGWRPIRSSLFSVCFYGEPVPYYPQKGHLWDSCSLPYRPTASRQSRRNTRRRRQRQ